MIVGAPKAGTTSLKAWLGQHPDVATHDAREFIFFASDGAFSRGYEAAFGSHFDARARGAAARVAKSVAMMYSREALERLAAHNPATQVVLVLREPVARAHSEFWYAKRRGREGARTFEEALERCMAATVEDPREQDAYLARSRYLEHVEAVLARFPASQVSVLLLEELERDPESACRRLLSRLPGIDADVPFSARQRHNEAAAPRSRLLLYLTTQARKQPLLRAALRSVLGAESRKRLRTALMGLNDQRFEIPALAPETRDRLAHYFAPWNDRLEARLGRSLADWQGVSRTSGGRA